MSNSGWIKLHRRFLSWEWANDPKMVSLFIHLLLAANHKPRKWRGRTIDRGQVLTSLSKLSAETGISVRSIRTCLERLKLTNELTSKVTNLNRVITIINYDTYQTLTESTDKQTDKPAVNQLTSDRQTNKQELKELKEVKNNKADSPPTPPGGAIEKRLTKAKQVKELFDARTGAWLGTDATEALEKWLKYRAEMGKPINPTGFKTILKQYNHKVIAFIAAVEHSVKNGYQGLFEPHAAKATGKQPLTIDEQLEVFMKKQEGESWQ